MNLPRRVTLGAALAALWACGGGEEPFNPSQPPLLPFPVELKPGKGEFLFGPDTRLVLEAEPEQLGALDEVVDRWAASLRRASGFPLPIVHTPPDRKGRDVRVSLVGRRPGSFRLVPWTDTPDPVHQPLSPPARGAEPLPAPGEAPPGVEAEAYELRVTPKGVELRARALPGVYYGLGTLGRLTAGAPEALPGEGTSASGERSPARGTAGARPVGDRRTFRPPWSVPALTLRDRPRFPYRGMHLDVGRHFFGVEAVKRYLDLLAAYRMNVFHWHLTEDQGWRIQIRRFPRLTEVGGCRAETMVGKNFDPYVGDGIPHCGYYTQDEIREVVAYARERFITVIPEIEMPGHSMAALAAYPDLACTPGPFQVYTRWGITQDIYCPKEETFAFLEGVLTEVMELFPSRYIHIGGDEAPKDRWRESPLAQEVIRREGLADADELQSWFIRRIGTFLAAHGRRLIGWDEILEGGLAPGATVMSWRGEEGAVAAARMGHDAIMTPTSWAYFDYYQGDPAQEPLAIGGFLPLEKVYAFEPVPRELGPREARHILGAQGNVWTEYMATWDHVEYMVLPRMLALAEVLWSPREKRRWEDFLTRLPAHLALLDRAGYRFRIPDVRGLERDRLSLADTLRLELSVPFPQAAIRYTLDGTVPDTLSAVYVGPLPLALSPEGVTVTARASLPDGRLGPWRSARFARTTLLPPSPLPPGPRLGGLAVQAYRGRFRTVEALEGGEPLDLPGGGGVPKVRLPEPAPEGSFGLVLEGFLRVPRTGIYTFYLTSDDGSRLSLGGRVVVDHDGPHGLTEKAGDVALVRGWHPVELRYFQAGGAKGLRLEVEGPGFGRREVPAPWLSRLGPGR